MKIAQREEYQGDGWWKWAVWIEGEPKEIKSIRSVTYTLHHTFRNPIRTVTNRGTKFRLIAGGYGGFPMAARVETESGEVRLLKHELELSYPPVGRLPRPKPQPTKASRRQKSNK